MPRISRPTASSDSLRQAFSEGNLERAWRWTRTNPDAQFKDYFRDIYTAYEVAAKKNLGLLRDALTSDTYQPRPACKLFLPKKSGILRPYSLICVEDQIVYQALVNIIAERLPKSAQRRYLVEVFGHLYAGKRSHLFYRKWQRSYRQFSDAIREAHSSGFVYGASFDLTAFYDSIDHVRLGNLLLSMRFDPEFIGFLVNCLRAWTPMNHAEREHHGHGIPQGPQPSGLLAEAVLGRLDAERHVSDDVRYLRYVDDIRLFGRSEHDLRHLLVELDLRSKRLGLYPQSSKINIHRITDIGAEVKSVSRPPELGIRPVHPDQSAIRKRIRELSPRYQVLERNQTRFKWVLAQAAPSKRVSQRLLRILKSRPDLYLSISRYFQRYERLDTDTALRVLNHTREEDLYAAPCAALLRAALGRIPAPLIREYVAYARREYWKKDKLPDRVELRTAAAAWLLSQREMTYQETRGALVLSGEWWMRKELLKFVDVNHVGGPSSAALLNAMLRDRVPDVSLVAAHALAQHGLAVETPRQGTNRLAELALQQLGMVGRVTSRYCGIDAALTDILGRRPLSRSWRTMLGENYRRAVTAVARAKAYLRTDPTAFVMIMDTFHDLLLDQLFQHDGTLGGYQLGNIGGVLNPTSRLAQRYPALYRAADDLHNKRRESELSHPYLKGTSMPTRRLDFRDLTKLKPVLLAGYAELDANW